jgi:hypothetical protein
MKYLAITEQQAQSIADYLVQKPYREVNGLIEILKSLKVIELKESITDTETEKKSDK